MNASFLASTMKCQVLRAGRPEARQRLARRPLRHARVQDVQDLVGRPGLRRRRQREHVVPAMVRLRRRRPLARVAGKVVERHRAADGSRLLDDGAGDRTLVEAVAALLLQDPERAGETRIAEDVARGRGVPVHVPRRDRIGVHLRAASARIPWCGPEPLRERPIVRDALGDGKTLLRVVDGRLQGLLEGERPEPMLHFIPAPRGAGYRDFQDAARRHSRSGRPVGGVPRVPERVHALEGRTGWRLAARVQCVQLVFAGDVDDREQVAGRADVHRLDDAEHRRGGDGSVNRVAALLQDVEPSLRGERLAGGDHSVARHHLRAPLQGPAFGSITRHGAAPRRGRRGVAGLHRRLRADDRRRARQDGDEKTRTQPLQPLHETHALPSRVPRAGLPPPELR